MPHVTRRTGNPVVSGRAYLFEAIKPRRAATRFRQMVFEKQGYAVMGSHLSCRRTGAEELDGNRSTFAMLLLKRDL